MPKILLIRAGATPWEEEGRLRGTLDIPLSPSGVEQARARAKEVSAWRLRAVWAGADQPARETGEVVAKAAGARVHAHEGLREPSLGLWQGLLEAEAVRKHRRAFTQWRSDPTSVSPPGGEPLEAAAARVAAALREIVARVREGDVVACVASPLASALAACALAGRPAREAFAALEVLAPVAVLDPGAGGRPSAAAPGPTEGTRGERRVAGESPVNPPPRPGANPRIPEGGAVADPFARPWPVGFG